MKRKYLFYSRLFRTNEEKQFAKKFQKKFESLKTKEEKVELILEIYRQFDMTKGLA